MSGLWLAHDVVIPHLSNFASPPKLRPRFYLRSLVALPTLGSSRAPPSLVHMPAFTDSAVVLSLF